MHFYVYVAVHLERVNFENSSFKWTKLVLQIGIMTICKTDYYNNYSMITILMCKSKQPYHNIYAGKSPIKHVVIKKLRLRTLYLSSPFFYLKLIFKYKIVHFMFSRPFSTQSREFIIYRVKDLFNETIQNEGRTLQNFRLNPSLSNERKVRSN